MESSFQSHKLSFPTSSSAVDVNRPEISRLLKQVQHLFILRYLKCVTKQTHYSALCLSVSPSILLQIRLMNDFQKEVTTFWIRHPEK